MTDKTAKLTIDGKDIDLPIYEATNGPDVVDVGKLTGQGYFTYDPGFVSTAACDSEITFIDGDQGILLHRGYPIEQLAEKSQHLELCYLLLNGELPSESELNEFIASVNLAQPLTLNLRSSLKVSKLTLIRWLLCVE